VKQVLMRPSAAREFEALSARDRDLVDATIDRFARTGEGDVKMLVDADRHLRLRAGDWRIRFVFEQPDIIRVLSIRHRREAYR